MEIQDALNAAFDPSSSKTTAPIVLGINSEGDLTLTDTAGNAFYINAAPGDPALTQLFLPLPTVGANFSDIQDMLTDLWHQLNVSGIHQRPVHLHVQHPEQPVTFRH